MPQEIAGRLRPPSRDLDGYTRELNGELRRLAELIGRLGGFDGETTARTSPLDLSGQRLRRVGRAQTESDAVNVAYLRETAIVAHPGDPYRADRLIEARGGVRVHEYAREPFDLVPLAQLEDLIEDIVSSRIAEFVGGGDGDTAGATFVDNETPSGAKPGTTFTLANTPTLDSERVYVDGARLRKAVAPGLGEYSISGAVITTGFTVAASSEIWADYRRPSGGFVDNEAPAGAIPGTTFVLANLPVLDSEKVYVNGIRLFKSSTPGLGEYSISGATITTGFTVQVGDWIWVDYRVSTTSSTFADNEVPGGTKPGTTFTLDNTPLGGSEHVYVNGTRLRFAASPGLNEYSIVGAIITTGFTVGATDQIWVDYRY